MAGVFAFFLESAFLGLFLFGETRLGPRGHLAMAIALFLGSWLSGYFIIVTNAFMQHPVGCRTASDGTLQLASFGEFLLSPWAIWKYAHNMTASVITASFVVSAVGAYPAVIGQHAEHATICLRTGVTTGIISCVLVLFPTGDRQGKLVADHQPVTLADGPGAGPQPGQGQEGVADRPALVGGGHDRDIPRAARGLEESGRPALVPGLRPAHGGGIRRWFPLPDPGAGAGGLSFLSWCALLLGLFGAAMACNYPYWLRSTLEPIHGLTAQNSAAGTYGLRGALYWWTIGTALAGAYFVSVFRSFRGKVDPTAEGHGY
jgi:hypothetical protein